MRALILAAGRGSRLGKKSSDVPKCLLEVGRRPLIEHQLEMLSEAGIGPVGMVVGYCADEIREVVGIRAEYVINARWSATNSLYSFSLAREWCDGEPLLIMNADTLVHPEILDRLLRAKGDAFAFDSRSGHGREHMKVQVESGRLVTMGKDLPAADVSGENVGVLALTAKTAERLFGLADEVLVEEGEKPWLGSAVCRLAAECELEAVDVAGLPWGEVDFPFDLERVRKEVWPAIERSAWKRRYHWREMRLALTGAALVLAVYLGLHAWGAPEGFAWARVDIDAAEEVEIVGGDQTQRWSLLENDQQVSMRVTGPGEVRVESRVLLDSPTEEPVPYVLEVELDGKRVDWFKEDSLPSRTWVHDEWTVNKKRRVSLEVGPGPHVVRLRLVAADSRRCLVRVSQVDVEPSED